MPRRYYAGVGSREITSQEVELLVRIARELRRLGWHLISGNAPGADQAFQTGAAPDCTLLLPWDGFEYYAWDPIQYGVSAIVCGDTEDAQRYADRVYGKGRGKPGGRSLVGRDYHQALGLPQCGAPEFVIFCANEFPGPEGRQVQGGTRHAVGLARDHNIPAFNTRWADDIHPFIKHTGVQLWS